MSLVDTLRATLRSLYDQLNWFRIHLLAFTFIPILFSGFFIAANPAGSSGQYITTYIDALLSALQPVQQAFLFILMLLGDISIINLITIFARQRWFRIKGKRVAESTILADLHRRGGKDDQEQGQAESGASSRGSGVHDEPGRERGQPGSGSDHGGNHDDESESSQPLIEKDDNPWNEGFRRRANLRQKPHDPRRQPRDPHGHVPHASSGRTAHNGRGGFPSIHIALFRLIHQVLPHTMSKLHTFFRQSEQDETAHSSHPLREITQAVQKPFEERKDQAEAKEARRVKWLPKGMRNVVVGRNSQFFEEELSDEELELLGALEYKATNVLTILLVCHQLFWILVPSAIVSIYFAKVDTWDADFVSNGSTQSGTVNRTWYAFFQVASAYSSCGLSLIDTLMVPFQRCYLLIYVLIFPMMAGNQALPLFLRAEIWLFSKMVRPGTELEVSLDFIQTHSRRLFLYLFPTYQSLWLLGIEGFLWVLGVVGFVAYNHGLPYYNTLGSGWDKFTLGLFEGLAARASGFGIVSINDLAPAMNFLYLILIFTCNYPIVMAIRSTNVYEERALGIHGEHAPHQSNQQKQGGGKVFSKYLKHHLLPQIYFDLWPIAMGTMIILAIERGRLLSDDNTSWINEWRVLFETTSAYGTVGLSYNNPYNTSSLSASFRKLSKFIIILLMLRGRHRGLPLAIDRAIMFPVEYLRFSHEEREKVEEDRVHQAGEEAEGQ